MMSSPACQGDMAEDRRNALAIAVFTLIDFNRIMKTIISLAAELKRWNPAFRHIFLFLKPIIIIGVVAGVKILFIFLFTVVVNIEPSSWLQRQQTVAVFLFRFWRNYPDVDFTSRKFLWTFWNGETGSVFDSTSLSSIYQRVFETQSITYSFKWKLGQIWADRLSLHTTKTWILHSCQ